MPLSVLLTIIGLIGGTIVAVVGSMVYLLKLMFNIGTKLSNIESKMDNVSEKMGYIPHLFHISESHGNRLTKIETKLDINTSNGSWYDR